MVSPLDTVTSKKNNISNFRQIFQKYYERVTKKLLDKAMNKYGSLFISAHRQYYSIPSMFTRGIRVGLDNNFVKEVSSWTYLMFSIVFAMIF